MNRLTSVVLIVVTGIILYFCAQVQTTHGRAAGIWLFVVLVNASILSVAVGALIHTQPKRIRARSRR